VLSLLLYMYIFTTYSCYYRHWRTE